MQTSFESYSKAATSTNRASSPTFEVLEHNYQYIRQSGVLTDSACLRGKEIKMDLQVFENQEFGLVRTIALENGTVLFCGFDVASALGYAKPRNALSTHAKGALKQGVLTDGGIQEMIFIPEPDVYRLIIRSKLPAAEKFEQWLMESVLPSIRRHGAYVTKETLDKLMTNPDFAIGLFTRLKNEQERNAQLSVQVETMGPKAEYYDALVETNLLTNIRQTAKEMHLGEKAFTSMLIELGLCYRSPRGIIMPYAGMTEKGYAQIKEYTNGEWSGVCTLFTPAGRAFIRKKLEKKLLMTI